MDSTLFSKSFWQTLTHNQRSKQTDQTDFGRSHISAERGVRRKMILLIFADLWSANQNHYITNLQVLPEHSFFFYVEDFLNEINVLEHNTVK